MGGASVASLSLAVVAMAWCTTQHSWICSPSSINGNSITWEEKKKKHTFVCLSTRPDSFSARKSLSTTSSSSQPNAESPSPSSSSSSVSNSEAQLSRKDPVELAFARAKAYKTSKQPSPGPGIVENPAVDPKENKGNENGGSNLRDNMIEKEVVDGSKNTIEGNAASSGLEEGNKGISGGGNLKENVVSKDALAVSRIDFMGLNFSDKKKARGLPAGLVPVADPFPEGDLPEVELIVGDINRLGTPLVPDPQQEDNLDFYKPKVSTWGVFPRPQNISKTFGGGRVIRPGEVLETEEDKAIKEARTSKLLAAYKKKVGLNTNPRLTSECEKALTDGNSLMDAGKLEDALCYYEQVMEKLDFQNELHGLAALQWSICQDSLSRSKEARVMYERLLSHPNVRVRKKAREFMFVYEATEKMKIKSSLVDSKNTDYQRYFEAFVEGKMNFPVVEAEEEEAALSHTIPYVVILLVSPIVVVLLLAAKKGTYF